MLCAGRKGIGLIALLCLLPRPCDGASLQTPLGPPSSLHLTALTVRFRDDPISPAPGNDIDETTLLWLADVEIPCEVFALLLPTGGLEGIDAQMATRTLQAAGGRTLILTTLGCFGPPQGGGRGMVAKALAAGIYGEGSAAGQRHHAIQRRAWSQLLALAKLPVPHNGAVTGEFSLRLVTEAQLAGAVHLVLAEDQGMASGPFTARRCYARYPSRSVEIGAHRGGFRGPEAQPAVEACKLL